LNIFIPSIIFKKERKKIYYILILISISSFVYLKDMNPWMASKFRLSIRNTFDLIIDTLGDRTNTITRDMIVLTLVADAANRRNDSSSASTKGFKHTTLFESLCNFSHGVVTLADLEFLPATSKLESTATSDTRKDHISDKRAGDELLLTLFVHPEDEEVHGTYLSDLIIEQPENLIVTLLSSLSLRNKSDSIVTTNLVATTATGPSTAVFTLIAKKLDWLPAGGVVWTNRAEDDKDLCLLRKSNTNCRMSGDVSGTDVKREAFTLWDPILIEKNKLLDTSQKTFSIKGRKTNTLTRAVHTSHVKLWTEHTRTTIRTTESLHTLETFNSIMEN